MLYSSTVATATTDQMMNKTQQHPFNPSYSLNHKRKATDSVAEIPFRCFSKILQ